MFDNWREAFAALKKRIEEVFSSVEGIKDELVKQRRAHEDEINNITFDNMPSIKKVLLQSDNSVAGLTVKVDKNAADIKAVAETVNSLDNIYASASYEQKVDAQEAQITSLVQFQDNTTKNISLIKAVSDKNKSDIVLLTKTDTELSQSIAKVNVKTSENQSQIENVAKVVAQNVSSIATIEQTATDQGAEIAILAKWQNEADGKYASSSLTQTVSDQGVQIADLQTWQNEADGKYASSSLTKTVNDQGVQISDLQTWQNEADGKYASAEIVQTVNDQGAQIALAVSRADEASEKATNGASIVAAINENNESSVKIKADKLNFQGVSVFVRPEQLDGSSDVEQTVIDGGNIRAKSLSVDSLSLNENGQIDFSNLGMLSFSAKNSSANGEIRLSTNEYDEGEIAISANGSTSLAAGRASLILSAGDISDSISFYADDINVYAQKFSMNGREGKTGTININGFEIEVENGLIVGWSGNVGRVATPIISPVSGVYDNPLTIHIECATPGATIYYSINGTTYEYSESFNIYYDVEGEHVVIDAWARLDGMGDSDWATEEYTLQGV